MNKKRPRLKNMNKFNQMFVFLIEFDVIKKFKGD